MGNDSAIKKFIAEHLGAGDSLSDIQEAVNEKFSTEFTFLDIRLMAAELESIDWAAEDAKEKAQAMTEEAKEEKAAAETTDGQTVVELSKLVRPGALVSGSVKFASGAAAEWMLDQSGRLGLDKVQGEPTEEDFKLFQAELQRIFSSNPPL